MAKQLENLSVRELTQVYNTILVDRGKKPISDFPNKDMGRLVVGDLLPENADIDAMIASSPPLPEKQTRGPREPREPRGPRERPPALNEIGLRTNSIRATAWEVWRSRENGQITRNELANEIYAKGDSASARTAASQVLSALARSAVAYGFTVEKTKEDNGEIVYHLSGEGGRKPDDEDDDNSETDETDDNGTDEATTGGADQSGEATAS
jgi:hypothetical protein